MISGVIAITALLFLGQSEKSSTNHPSYTLFISEIEPHEKFEEITQESDRSFLRVRGNNFHAYRPNQKFLLKIEFQHSLPEDNLSLQIRPVATALSARIYSKDFRLIQSNSSLSLKEPINYHASEFGLQQVGESKSPVLLMEVSNGLSEVIAIQFDKFHEANGREFFNSGLYLGVAFLCSLLPLFFYFQYKQKIFILLDAFLFSLVLKFLFTYALIPGEFFELLESVLRLNIVNGIFYLINILQSIFLIYFIKLIIKNKYIYGASLINFLIYLIYIFLNNSLVETILLNLFYINSYLLILSIFIIYNQQSKINVFMYFMGYGIQFFALYFLVIQYNFIDSPLDYSYYYFSVLPIAYLIFFIYILANYYHLILNEKIYAQNQSNIKAAYQLQLSKTVSDSQVLLLETISHELKSPLMALYFLTDGLSSAGEGLTSATQRIKSTLNQISYIVERFSSLSKFYSINELNIKKNIDIHLLITSLIEVRSDWKGINLQSNDDAKVESDDVLLQIIFQNLIENAIKYRMKPDSLIEINITHQNENLVLVDISNSLSQNAKMDLEKVFQMYYRGGNVKNEPGMGIGLWITKETAKKIKGNIIAIRDEDKVIFRVSIPISFQT